MTIAGETQKETFAAYLARALTAKKGYRPGTVPEARALFDYCDAVLTRADGMSLIIVGIVSRESDPTRSFGLSKAALEKIGMDCLHYTGRVGSTKLPVHIVIIEVGRSPAAAADIERLKLLKSRSIFSKVSISAFALGLDLGELWSSTPLRGRAMRSFLKGLMSRPRLTDEELTPQQAAILPEHRPLYLTYGLLAALCAVFVAEYVFRVGAVHGLLDPGTGTLVALGALDGPLVSGEGEWWRLFSAPLLHGGVIHLVFNGVALFFAGAVLENVIGRAWFAAIFAVSGISGAFMSLLINPPNIISVGASGAIMGLFAAAFAVSYRYPTASPMRTFLVSGSLRVLIPSMLPLFDGLFGQKVDYAAHLGGALGGVAIGALLVLRWRRDELLPPYRHLAWGLVAAGLCGAVFAGVQIAGSYEEHTLESHLIPAAEAPKDLDAGMQDSQRLVARYPRDPRSHMYRALDLSLHGNGTDAEAEWKTALADDKMLKRFFKPALEEFIRANLAEALQRNGKTGEAIETAKPLCGVQGKTRDELAQMGLCPSPN